MAARASKQKLSLSLNAQANRTNARIADLYIISVQMLSHKMVKFHSICDDNNVILCKFIFVQPQKIYEQSFRFQFDHLLRAAFRHFKYINTLLLYSTLSHFPKHNTFSLCATTFYYYYYYLAENLRMHFSVLQWKWFSCLRFWICSKWRFKAMTHAFGSFVCLKSVEIFKILSISNIFFSKYFFFQTFFFEFLQNAIEHENNKSKVCTSS